jgi:hypothetical protein
VYGCNLHCGLLKGVGVRPDGCDTAHTWYEQDYPRAEWAYEASVGQAWQSWNSACSHGSSVVARGWCSSPAANLWSKGRRWASSCGAAGSGDGAPRSRPTAPWRLDGWAGPTAGLTTSTSPPSWRRASPGHRPGIQRIRPKAIAELLATGRPVWKFVAADVDDLDEIDWWIERFGLPIDNVWVMPEGTSTAGLTAHTQQLAEAVLARGLNLTTCLHILVWGAERGR